MRSAGVTLAAEREGAMTTAINECDRPEKKGIFVRHDRASYIWLAYSVFYFVDPILRHNALYWLECMSVFAVFVALYVAYVQTHSDRLRLALISGMFVLGVAMTPVNDGAISFMFYTAALLPFSVTSVPIVFGVILAESAVLIGMGGLLHHRLMSYSLSAFMMLVVGSGNFMIAQQKRAAMKLNAAREENAALAALADRERIARDLHDVLGHTLSVIVLKTELAGRLMGIDPVRAKAEIDDIERTARTALAEVREAIGGYRTRGLSAEVEQARRTLDAAGVSLRCDTQPPTLRPNDETVLSLALREAVTNIVRHARAKHCTLQFETTGDGYHLLLVEDDGNNVSGREGNGLRGMRERVQALGGRFRVERERGTRLVIELPAYLHGDV
jgi:two-component system sensor histidine kinase DesK